MSVSMKFKGIKMNAQILSENLNHFLSNPLVQKLMPSVDKHINVGDEDHSVYLSKKTKSSMVDFDRVVNQKWATTVHKCPKCKSIYTSIEDHNYIEEYGMCLRCEHFSTEVMLEGRAMLADMAEANGMSVEDYMEEMNL